MSTRENTIVVEHSAGGYNGTVEAKKIKRTENTLSRNMDYDKGGMVKCSSGFINDSVDWGESDAVPDGLYTMKYYPTLQFCAINGKIKYTDKADTTKSVYEADQGLTITAGEPVFFGEFRGMLYFCNGVDNFQRISVGRLASDHTTTSTQLDLDPEEGYRFKNATDKVYCEGDEIDYTAISDAGIGDSLTGATNIDADHDTGAWVTQANSVTSPTSGSIKAKCFAVFRDTIFYIPEDEPGILRYGDTISTVAELAAGNIHDFSGNENYIIGSGAKLTGLLADENRLYIFTEKEIHYITTQIDPTTGTLQFSVSYRFSPVYGIPNPFCVVATEGEYVIFTGSRFLRIGPRPYSDGILPDEKYDNNILNVLQKSSLQNQSKARIHYNSSTKNLYGTINVEGVLKTLKRNNLNGKWSWYLDHDIGFYDQYDRYTYFTNSTDNTVRYFDGSYDADGVSMPRHYKSARIEDGNLDSKLFVRGHVRGKMRRGTEIVFKTNIDGGEFGGNRYINEDNVEILSEEIYQDSSAVGGFSSGAVGGNIEGSENIIEFLYPFVVGTRGHDIQFEFSTNALSAWWGIETIDCKYIRHSFEPHTHR